MSHDDRSERAILGLRFYAFSAAYAALKHPDVFGAAASQSAYFGLGAEDELEAMIASRANPELRLYLDWNLLEERNADQNADVAADSKRLASLFETNGYSVSGGEMRDSYGWGGWRNRSASVLASLFPAR